MIYIAYGTSRTLGKSGKPTGQVRKERYAISAISLDEAKELLDHKIESLNKERFCDRAYDLVKLELITVIEHPVVFI